MNYFDTYIEMVSRDYANAHFEKPKSRNIDNLLDDSIFNKRRFRAEVSSKHEYFVFLKNKIQINPSTLSNGRVLISNTTKNLYFCNLDLTHDDLIIFANLNEGNNVTQNLITGWYVSKNYLLDKFIALYHSSNKFQLAVSYEFDLTDDLKEEIEQEYGEVFNRYNAIFE